MKLVIENLNKYYGDNHALCDFSFTFEPGVYGLLGPNGAGKSTFMKILTQNLKASSGNILLDDNNVVNMKKEYRSMLGYMPQQQNLYNDFTLNRFLHYIAALKGVKGNEAMAQIEKAADSVNLSSVMHEKLGTFSGGMKQRALLAQAVIGNPQILILDEPTAGLDPKERIRIRNLISQLAFDKIVIIATHVVPDIEFIAKEVLLLSSGKLIKADNPEAICKSIEGKVYESIVTDGSIVSEKMLNTDDSSICISEIVKKSGNIQVRFVTDSEKESNWTEVIPALEDVYLYYFREKGNV